MDKSLALCSLRLNCDWITYRGVNSFAIKCRMKRKQIRPMIEIERSRFAYIRIRSQLVVGASRFACGADEIVRRERYEERKRKSSVIFLRFEGGPKITADLDKITMTQIHRARGRAVTLPRVAR